MEAIVFASESELDRSDESHRQEVWIRVEIAMAPIGNDYDVFERFGLQFPRRC